MTVQTVHLVKDLDIKTKVNIQTNSNEDHKVSEIGSKEERKKLLLKKKVRKKQKE